MPNTTTATWPTLTAGKVARASDVESKFDWSEHSIWPHSTGTRVDNQFDLGDTTTAAWRSLYTYSINATSTARGLAIGTTTVANNSSTALEVSGTRAILISRLSTAQRDALTAADGMMIYNTTTAQFEFRENSAWRGVGGVTSVQEVSVSLNLQATATAGYISATTTTVAINTVTTANTVVIFQGMSRTNADIQRVQNILGAAELENATSVRFRLSGRSEGASDADNTITLYAVVVEY